MKEGGDHSPIDRRGCVIDEIETATLGLGSLMGSLARSLSARAQSLVMFSHSNRSTSLCTVPRVFSAASARQPPPTRTQAFAHVAV